MYEVDPETFECVLLLIPRMGRIDRFSNAALWRHIPGSPMSVPSMSLISRPKSAHRMFSFHLFSSLWYILPIFHFYSYHFEYSTRDTYGGGFSWPATAPLSE